MASGTNGSTILLADESAKVNSILLALIISSGEGKIQFTLSKRADVLADNANWIDWEAGSVTANTTDVLFPVSAVRAVRTSGTITIEARAV